MALESRKIPPFDSKSKTASHCMIQSVCSDFFKKKFTLSTQFSFYQYYFTENVEAFYFWKIYVLFQYKILCTRFFRLENSWIFNYIFQNVASDALEYVFLEIHESSALMAAKTTITKIFMFRLILAGQELIIIIHKKLKRSLKTLN